MAVAVAEAVAAGAAGPVHLPKVDTWQYRVINLANGLQAMLVHDSEADKAAASMDVRLATSIALSQWKVPVRHGDRRRQGGLSSSGCCRPRQSDAVA